MNFIQYIAFIDALRKIFPDIAFGAWAFDQISYFEIEPVVIKFLFSCVFHKFQSSNLISVHPRIQNEHDECPIQK